MNIIINKYETASIDVDAQYSFTPVCPDELPVPQGDEIAKALNDQAHFAQYRIGSKEAHPKHAVWIADEAHPTLSPLMGKNVDVHWPPHCIPGTKGFQTLADLPHPSEYDFFVWKGIEPDLHPYGSCYHDLHKQLSTGIIEFLKHKNVTTVIVGGLATDYCVKVTVLQLLMAGFKVILNLEACRGLSADTTAQAITLMASQGATIIDSTKALVLQSAEPLPLGKIS